MVHLSEVMLNLPHRTKICSPNINLWPNNSKWTGWQLCLYLQWVVLCEHQLTTIIVVVGGNLSGATMYNVYDGTSQQRWLMIDEMFQVQNTKIWPRDIFLLNKWVAMCVDRLAWTSTDNLTLWKQGILEGEVSLHSWPPVWLVWNQLYDYWQFLFLFAKWTNPNQSNIRSTVQWYFPL